MLICVARSAGQIVLSVQGLFHVLFVKPIVNAHKKEREQDSGGGPLPDFLVRLE